MTTLEKPITLVDAELVRLRREVEAITTIKAECDALRADAERYQWIKKQARWEPERDFGQGGRWWVILLVDEGQLTFDEAVTTIRQARAK